jgi:hypothetical protein
VPLGDGILPVRTGTTRAIAASFRERFPLAPEVPSFEGLGLGERHGNRPRRPWRHARAFPGARPRAVRGSGSAPWPPARWHPRSAGRSRA